MPSRPSEPGEPPAPEARPDSATGGAEQPAPQMGTGESGAGAQATGSVQGPDDHALLRRAQAGDEGAFAVLVERHQQRAFRVARNMVPTREDAEDLAQEAFLRVYRSLERFDYKHEFTTWLYRIVTNLCIDHLRKRRPAVSTSAGEDADDDLDLPDDAAPLPSDALERDETQTRVREVIDSLAPHFQAVLTLRELEGLSCVAIADIVDATHVTVRWRLHRGRKLFQEEWERRERLAAAGLDPTGSPFDDPADLPDPADRAGELELGGDSPHNSSNAPDLRP